MTEDFLKYLQDKVGGEESHDQENQEGVAEEPPPPHTSAEKVVWQLIIFKSSRFMLASLPLVAGR